MKKSRNGKVLFTSLLLAAGMTMTSFAGQWNFDGPENWKWHYQNDDGSYTTNGWQEIDGKWYHFDNDGYLDTGWHKIPSNTGDKWYLLDDSGAMVTGKEWEGGLLLNDGSLYMDEIDFEEDGTLVYWRFTGEAGRKDTTYRGTAEWKKELMSQFRDKISSVGYGKTQLDYQLPENWAEQSPEPLILAGITTLCNNIWGDYGWSNNFQIDDNNVIHITVERN